MIRRCLLWFLSLNRFVQLFLILVYMAVIYLLSAIQIDIDKETPYILEVLTNLCHVPLFMGLAMLLLPFVRTFFDRDEERHFSPWSLVFVVLFTVVFGITDEWHQSYTGRSSTVLDVVSDLIGGIWGVLVWGFFVDRRPTPTLFAVTCCVLTVLSLCAAMLQ